MTDFDQLERRAVTDEQRARILAGESVSTVLPPFGGVYEVESLDPAVTELELRVVTDEQRAQILAGKPMSEVLPPFGGIYLTLVPDPAPAPPAPPAVRHYSPAQQLFHDERAALEVIRDNMERAVAEGRPVSNEEKLNAIRAEARDMSENADEYAVGLAWDILNIIEGTALEYKNLPHAWNVGGLFDEVRRNSAADNPGD